MSGGRVVTLSPDQTQISTDKSFIAADGVDACTVYVAVSNTDQTNGEPNPMSGLAASNVVLAVTPSTGVTITQPTGVADASGVVSGSFVSTNAASVTVSATILGASVSSGGPVVVGGGDAPVDPPTGDPFFTDDFSTGSRTNANGFTWNSTGSGIAVTTTNPRAGQTHSLAFTFPATANDVDSSREQRFALGRNVTEIWLEYYLYVPANYVHRAQTGGTNNKFLRLWGDSYNANNKIGLSTFRNTSYGSDSFLAFERTFSGGGIGAQGSPEEEFGGGDIPAGAWTQLRFRFRLPSADGANDGVMTMWVNGTLAMTWAQPTTFPSIQYWNNGYFFGWSNSGYAEETVFQISEVKFYDSNPGWT